MTGNSRHFFTFFFFLLVLIGSAESADFTCPTKNITGGNGVFPPDQNFAVTFPSGYFCSVGFEIPDAFVVKITMQSNVTQLDQDSLVVVDSLSKLRVYSQGVHLFVAPAKTAYVVITSQSGTAQFWFRYEYVSLKYLEQVKYTTGVPFSLNLVNTKTYTVTSSKNEPIVMRSDPLVYREDIFLVNIYVYDGPDLNSPYVGTLYEYTYPQRNKTSTGNSLTFLNMYGTNSASFGIANEYSAISKYSFYTFKMFSQQIPVAGTFVNSNTTGDIFAITFYCTDCSKPILTHLSTPDTNERQFQFTPLSPSNTLNQYLTYKTKDELGRYMPQQIPGNLLTMTTDASQFATRLASETTADTMYWTSVYSGRKGYIFSPSLWSLDGDSSFSYKFDSTSPMTYSFNVDSAHFEATNEALNIQIGTPGTNPFSTTFTKDVQNPGVRVANGTFLQFNFTTVSSRSHATVSFEMEDVNGPTTVATTVPTTVETTTKSTRGRLDSFMTVFFLGITRLL